VTAGVQEAAATAASPTEPDQALDRFPLSCTQEMWCQGDEGDQAGTFSPRFLSTRTVRITGRVDVGALQGALDDVVRRHESLRTIVVRDAEPRYQQVYPASPVPLQVRDLPPVTDRPRDVYAEEVMLEAEHGSLDPRELPLLRARLERFDDQDSVLILVSHHTASDGWSMQLILRDLAACYAARTAGRPADLPDIWQYRDFVAWERARLADSAAGGAVDYWRTKLSGARIFALPTDRPIPAQHTQPYSAHYFVIDADVMSAISALAREMRSSAFMVLLAAFNVLAHQITGTTDPVIKTLSNARNETETQGIVGTFMNFLPLRTGIGECGTFLDVITQTRRTCLEAYSYEIPIQHIERELPELMQPIDNSRLSHIILGMFQPQFEDQEFQIAESSYQVRKRVVQEPVASEIPMGAAWQMDFLPSGELIGYLHYNLDEFDEGSALDWVAGYQRILSRAVLDPRQDWRALSMSLEEYR